MKIKRIIPISIKKFARKFIDKFIVKRRYIKKTKKIMKNVDCESKIVYLFATPFSGNLGDHLITRSVRNFMDNNLELCNIIEITIPHFIFDKNNIKKFIKPDDLLLVTGGGFMGSLWPEGELVVRDVVEMFPNNKIVIFPQTIYFSKDDKGRSMKEESKRIYNQHENLFISVREKRSLELLKCEFNLMKNEIYVPDIALFEKVTINREIFDRDGMLMCMRSDKEKIDNSVYLNYLMRYSEENQINYVYTDTVVDKKLDELMRDKFLKEKLNEMKKSRIVVTDRLHGMIMSVISETPCIVFDNSSGKVSGVYNWISHLPQILMIQDMNAVEMNMKKIDRFLEKYYHSRDEILDLDLRENFKPLAEIIKG